MPPITAVLAGFGSAQWVSQDFPECAKSGHVMKDILGKNILQFGFLLTELIKSCLGNEELTEVHFPYFLVLFPSKNYKCRSYYLMINPSVDFDGSFTDICVAEVPSSPRMMETMISF